MGFIVSLWSLFMRITAWVFLLFVSSLVSAQQKTTPKLHVSCSLEPGSSAPNGILDLNISIENVGTSDIYLYRPIEWGWAGVRFRVINSEGRVVEMKNWTVPPPPPPVYGKENLVGIAPTYFYGTHMHINLREYYDLKPGIYYFQVSYRSNYRAEDGFGLPMLTFQDGDFLSNKVRIEIPTA
jgi:hypothetical protein